MKTDTRFALLIALTLFFLSGCKKNEDYLPKAAAATVAEPSPTGVPVAFEAVGNGRLAGKVRIEHSK